MVLSPLQVGQTNLQVLEVEDDILVLGEGLAEVANDHVAIAKGADIENANTVVKLLDIVGGNDFPDLARSLKLVLKRGKRVSLVAVNLVPGLVTIVGGRGQRDGSSTAEVDQLLVRIDRHGGTTSVTSMVKDGSRSNSGVQWLRFIANAELGEANSPVFVQCRVVNEVDDIDFGEADDIVPCHTALDESGVVATQGL